MDAPDNHALPMQDSSTFLAELKGDEVMINSSTDSQIDMVVAVTLYQRGLMPLADACRLTAMSEASFLEAVYVAEKVAAETNPLIVQERRLSLTPDFKLSVLMPVYNERQTIRQVL